MKEEITFNVNNWVKVKLNDYGRLILREDHCFQTVDIKTDSEGYSKFQLWELFNLFGRYINLGQNLPFDSEIILLK